MGRDHTIYATEAGFVKYYKDPEKHPKRQYIGVVFERNQVLPLPRNSMRRRRLGLAATKMDFSTLTEAAESPALGVGIEPAQKTEESQTEEVAAAQKAPTRKPKIKERRGEEGRVLTLRPGYMYRESNWEIGRAAERAKVQVREFKPRDRWTAWRKTAVRKAKNAEKRSLRRPTKGKK
jgi:large subunit ribosomal protein L27